jgi:hypothetical protein
MSDFYIAVNADPAHIDSINVNDVTTYIILDGTLDLSTPGVIRWQQRIAGADADERINAANALFRLIRRAAHAESIGSSITFSMRRGGTEYVHFDLTGMNDPERNIRVLPGGASAIYDMEVTCYPYPRGDAALITGDISGTHAGATAAFLVTDVPGHIDALAHLELTDTSATGVINRVRASIIRGDFTASTDYTPWVDANALTGATDTADANSYGSDYATRTLTSTSFANIARGVQPAGARQQGRMDGYARVYSTGTAIGTPGSLTGTVQRSPSSVRQSATDNTASIAPAWASTTLDGSTLLGIVGGINTGGTGMTPGTTPANYSLVTFRTSGTTPSGGVASAEAFAAAYTREAAPATAAATTVPMNVTGETLGGESGIILELANVDSMTADLGSIGGFSPVDIPLFTPPSVPCLLIAYANGADAVPTIGSGFTTVATADGLIVSRKRVTSAGAFRLSVTTSGSGACLVNMFCFSEVEALASYALDAGTYTARVQAIDEAGYRSNATASATATPTINQNAVAWSWTAATNATAYALTIQYGSRFYEVITTGTSYELVTMAGLKEVAALPATSGATAPPPSLRARIGTANDHTLTTLPDVALSGAGAFEMVRLFSNRMLPPIDAPLADTWPDYAVEVQGRSANGANATVRVDAYWIVPCREPQVEAWIQGLAHATKRRWILESHRSGKGAFGWLENTSGGAEVGRLTTAGSLLIPPGNSIVLLEFEQASDVHTFAAQVTASLTVFPRQRWEATL